MLWVGAAVLALAASLWLFRAKLDFTPEVIIALVGAFALALALIFLSLIAVFIEARDLAELQARLDKLEAEHRDAVAASEAGAVEMGLSPARRAED